MYDRHEAVRKLDLMEGTIVGDDALALLAKALCELAEMAILSKSGAERSADWGRRLGVARDLVRAVRDEMMAAAERRTG